MSAQSGELAAIQLPRLSQYPVQRIGEALDRLELRDYADELVVVGGAAMAAYGIKDPGKTDLDLVVTEELMKVLDQKALWGRGMGSHDDALIADGQGVVDMRDLGSGKLGLVSGDVSAMVMPVDDLYEVTSGTLIKEGVVSPYSPYRFAPLSRILEWKLVLAGSEQYDGDKEKHIRDVKRIGRWSVRQEEVAAERPWA